MAEWQRIVSDLEADGVLLVQDGNHGEYRPRPAEFGDTGTAFIRAADMRGGRVLFESAQKINEIARGRVRKGIGAPCDVILSHKGTVGKVAFAPAVSPPFVCSPQTTFWRSLNHEVIDPLYLYAFLQSEPFREQLRARENESDMAAYVSLTEQRRLSVTVPPLEIQRAISDVLGALDGKIAANEHIADCAEKLGGALFERSFAEAILHLVDGAELPNGWIASDLGAATETIETGNRPKGGVAKYTSGIPSIGAESIVRLAQFDFSKVKYVPEDFFAGMKRGIVQDRDILVYKDGGKPGDFKPHVSMFGNRFPFSRMCINEHVYRVRMKSKFGQEFGYYWLSSPFVMGEMRRRGTGAAIPGINSTAVKGIPVVEPPTDRLLEFRETTAPLVERVLQAASEARTLATLRDTLLPQLMSGKLRIRDAEKIVEDSV
ncbi:restriction endonuclease subunit S [Streptomyces sp. NBC_01794]|uniref:restriction endonuclease subunit S n=1 Tax=Streptomyces sp. NBC_01794 TaxID=2975942 RepID=UPI00308B7BC6|nr:restriction endonuclease subunit S [Streptomyces sp. NBC_01794]